MPRKPSEFWALVVKQRGTKACWLWSRPTKARYPQLRWEGKRTTTQRLAYELGVGPIPEGLSVLHRCDEPRCCKPSHLFLGTQTDNMEDRDTKGRNGNIKLTADNVREIRAMAKYRTHKFIAEKFGVRADYLGKLLAGHYRGRVG